MAMAVNFGYRRDRRKTATLMVVTALLGATFVGMQAFEWTKLITEGVRPWGNPWGAAQFGSSFFMITGFHGTHVTIGVIFLLIIARKVLRGDYDRGGPGFFTSRRGRYEMRRDHGPLLALRRPGLGVHLRFLLSVVRTVMAEATAPATAIPHAAEGHAEGQQHPIRLYLVVWAWLFVLSACSYMVDYFGVQGLSALGADPDLHDAEGRPDRRRYSCTWHGSGWRWPTPSSCRRSSCSCSWR